MMNGVYVLSGAFVTHGGKLTVGEPPTVAEDLLDLYRTVVWRPQVSLEPGMKSIVAVTDGVGGKEIAQLALAIRLNGRPGLAIRAILEGWDLETIVRELY